MGDVDQVEQQQQRCRAHALSILSLPSNSTELPLHARSPHFLLPITMKTPGKLPRSSSVSSSASAPPSQAPAPPPNSTALNGVFTRLNSTSATRPSKKAGSTKYHNPFQFTYAKDLPMSVGYNDDRLKEEKERGAVELKRVAGEAESETSKSCLTQRKCRRVLKTTVGLERGSTLCVELARRRGSSPRSNSSARAGR